MSVPKHDHDYGFTHQGKVYTPNATQGVNPQTSDNRNKAIEAQELTIWQGQPDRMLAYYKFPAEQGGGKYRTSFYPSLAGASVSTWPGTVLGTITYAHVYRHNFGSRMVSLRVLGSNGAIYHGRASWDNGECVWLKRTKYSGKT